MKHLCEILMFVAWPIFIYISYKLCFLAIKKYEKGDS